MLPVRCPRCRARILPLRAERCGPQRRCPQCGCYIECVNGWKVATLLGLLLGAAAGGLHFTLGLTGAPLLATVCVVGAGLGLGLRRMAIYAAFPRPVPVSAPVRRLGRIALGFTLAGIVLALLPGLLVQHLLLRARQVPVHQVDPEALITALALAAAIPLALSLACAGIALAALGRQARARRAQLAEEQA